MSSAKWSSILIMCLGFALTLSARAETAPTALTFKTWKEQQILQAQNHLLRLSADLATQKKTTDQTSETKKLSLKEKAAERFRMKSSVSKLEKLENEVKAAQETVKIAMDLGLEDYVSVYLPTLSPSTESLDQLLEQMTKEEISKVMAELLKKQSDQRDSLNKATSRVGQMFKAAANTNP